MIDEKGRVVDQELRDAFRLLVTILNNSSNHISQNDVNDIMNFIGE
jgi:Ca2+-binding EF-hand superfamily protein